MAKKKLKKDKKFINLNNEVRDDVKELSKFISNVVGAKLTVNITNKNELTSVTIRVGETPARNVDVIVDVKDGVISTSLNLETRTSVEELSNYEDILENIDKHRNLLIMLANVYHNRMIWVLYKIDTTHSIYCSLSSLTNSLGGMTNYVALVALLDKIPGIGGDFNPLLLPSKYSDNILTDSEALYNQLFEIIVTKEVERATPEKRSGLINKNIPIWEDINTKILKLACDDGFYLGLGNELLPSGVDSVYDLIEYIRTLGLRKETLNSVIGVLMTSNCFKIYRDCQ